MRIVEVVDVQVVDASDCEVGAPVHVVPGLVTVPAVGIVWVPRGPAACTSSSSPSASPAAVLHERHSLPGIVSRSLDSEARLVVIQEARGLDHRLRIIILAFGHVVGQFCFERPVAGAVGAPEDHACQVGLAAVGFRPL